MSAALALGAEYVGKQAICNGREIASVTTQARAEAESILASGERAKAIIPFTVGIATTAAAFALLAPIFIRDVKSKWDLMVFTEIYLFMPLVSILAAAVSGLALQVCHHLGFKVGFHSTMYASFS